jgi:2-polyprenyl-3-methyl-5-hydroxy-6-metoxy-1,4-benzoquinol methylase
MALDHSRTYTALGIKNIGHRHRLNVIISAVSRFRSAAPQSYADVGCSNGFVTDRVRRTLSLDRADGYDHVAEHFPVGSTRHPKVRFSTHDICATPLPKRYQLITCFETLEHVGDPQRAVSNLLESVEEGGILFVSVPIEHGLRGLLKYLVKRYLYRYSLKELPQGESVAGRYVTALAKNERIDRFREDGRSGWGTHFGFDARVIGDAVSEAAASVEDWKSVFTQFYLVRQQPGTVK